MKSVSGKTALVLEGGAMRGMFTAGILDVFMEHGIEFSACIGVSAGAVFGCNYKSKQMGRAIRYNKKYCKDKRYCSFHSLRTTGDLYGADFCYNELPNRLDPFDVATYAANPMDFYCVATDVDSGEATYSLINKGDADDIRWMRASASMPIVSRPVEIQGKRYLDGGIVDPIPFAYMERIGYEHSVVILTQPDGFVKKKSKAQWLLNLALKKTPAVMKAMKIRHIIYNKQLAELERREREGTVLVLRPPMSLGISRTERNPSELERVYQIGRQLALERLDDVQAFLARN